MRHVRPNRLLLCVSNEGDYLGHLIPLILVARQVLKIHPNPKQKIRIMAKLGGHAIWSNLGVPNDRLVRYEFYLYFVIGYL